MTLAELLNHLEVDIGRELNDADRAYVKRLYVGSDNVELAYIATAPSEVTLVAVLDRFVRSAVAYATVETVISKYLKWDVRVEALHRDFATACFESCRGHKSLQKSIDVNPPD